MKNLILLLLFLFTHQVVAQKYNVEGNNIVVSKTVENVEGSKEEIYSRVKSYFVRSYGSANSVIQTDDKSGGLIIGKGLYADLASYILGAWSTKAYHIIRVDIKDGRARIIANASSIIANSKDYPSDKYEYEITKYYPITDKRAKGLTKKAQEESLNNLIVRLHHTVVSIEEAIKNKGQLDSEKTDW